ncbi:E3 SUMO-protein ligase ZBED1-like [Hemibagrus wyckioides]|uniref:E3 SUMO-protein ligase ZBED1-like n=1 Tax=Hemibagrus wyckioides TaxID=337641 RepID=UPI00266C0391|nr:E3 SUMO-protein ligase ZBED1-like [Hemibagrus wyckioides]
MAEQQEEGAGVRTLVPKKGSHSIVWNYFGFEENDVDQVRVLCELCSCSVQTSQAPAAESTAAGLKEAISAWGLLEERLACITTDNAADMIRAASMNNWTRLHCFGHRLHLAIENAMKDPRIDRAVGVCKKLVSTFSYSWKRKREFIAAQKELKLPEHSLKTECPARWGSCQAMIERVIEQQKDIAHVLSSDKKSRHLIPTWQDMDVLESDGRVWVWRIPGDSFNFSFLGQGEQCSCSPEP